MVPWAIQFAEMARSRSGFWGAVVDGFLEIKGQFLAVFSVLVAGGFKILKSDATWLEIAAVVAIYLNLILIASLALALRKALRHLTGFDSWKVVSVLRPTPPHTDCTLICVTEAVTRPEVTTMVHFLRYSSGIESWVGTGSVRWVQADEKIQISLDETYDTPDVETFIAALLANNKPAMDELRLRAGHMARTSMKGTEGARRALPPMGEAPPLPAQPSADEGEEL